MRNRYILTVILLGLAASALAQTNGPSVVPQDNPDSNTQPVPPLPPNPSQPPTPPQEDKRIFGVLPNYRTTEASIPFQTITAKQKLTIAAKDSFTWPAYVTAGAFASLYQLENQNPSFGQGMAGYAKRAASAYGDQMIGNMFQEGIIPALGHQDPRYFRLGEGTRMHRALYALSQIFVARMDSGRKTFNFSEWGGAVAVAAISNAYYPDTRDVSDNLQKVFIATATDAFSNVAKEFWPDIKHYFQRRRREKESSR
ncbi:MAG: hypothetical protein JO336_13410 [Acidobacteriia bacterium]|nr:hypothetical protein [Terriglobia bacterium]MBV8907330.1 hypothetical protein [Terriglobia bacterium]